MTKSAKPAILIVDDDEQNLAVFEMLLTEEQFTVVKARDGVEGLDMFEKIQPDIVLLDLMLPRLNGYEVCKRLKHSVTGRHVPVIMLSGYMETEAKRQALEFGADDFLTKPVELSKLLTCIRSHLPR